MAKKSKKKSFKQNWISFVPLLAAVLGVAAICFLFAPGMVKAEENVPLLIAGYPAALSGFQMMFGASTKAQVLGSTVVTDYFEFSFLNLLTLIFLVAGIVLLVLSFLKGSKLFAFIGTICFVLAAVWLFCGVNFVQVAEARLANIGADNVEEYIAQARGVYSLGWGSIVAAIVTILAALSSIFPAVFARFKK